MLIQRMSPISGKTNTMDLDVTEAQLYAWERGMLIQEAMPHLTPDEREFLISGVLPDEWDQMFLGEP